jgi:hypothetical protein
MMADREVEWDVMGNGTCERGTAVDHTYAFWGAEGDKGEGFGLREVGVDESDGGGTAINQGFRFDRYSIVGVVCDSNPSN